MIHLPHASWDGSPPVFSTLNLTLLARSEVSVQAVSIYLDSGIDKTVSQF